VQETINSLLRAKAQRSEGRGRKGKRRAAGDCRSELSSVRVNSRKWVQARGREEGHIKSPSPCFLDAAWCGEHALQMLNSEASPKRAVHKLSKCSFVADKVVNSCTHPPTYFTARHLQCETPQRLLTGHAGSLHESCVQSFLPPCTYCDAELCSAYPTFGTLKRTLLIDTHAC
jgi:hypothetical protein